MSDWTEKEKYIFESGTKKRPHVVILGAGASIAEIPHGDKNGRKISVMNDFLENLGIQHVLDGVALRTTSKNIEDIYSELYERSDLQDVRKHIEEAIYEYFCQFEIPAAPTVYDLLLLSLQPKDLVATFNWDPLLLQAYQRASNITSQLPELVFLHGNVGAGICYEHKRGGPMGCLCPVCHKPFSPTKLMFPVKNKNYTDDVAILDAWNALQHYMQKAYIITIFGYSAPPSDFEAVQLLKNAWGNTEQRRFEETEIIDIKDEESLRAVWEPFIHTHHYEIYDSFYNSLLGSFPRRTCDCIFDQTMMCKWLDGRNGFKQGMSWNELESFLYPLLIDENTSDGILVNPYIAKK